MRRKKHKQTRRAMRFYRINYGFRPPYKVLLDGNFVHALEAMKRGDSAELLPKLLGEPCRLFTTKCVMHELRGLGKEYAGTRQVLKRYALHRCGHGTHVSAADCLASQVTGGGGAAKQQGQERGGGETPAAAEDDEDAKVAEGGSSGSESDDEGEGAGQQAATGKAGGGGGRGDGNAEHFFVATQDRGLQRRVMSSPGGAVVFASVSGLHLEQPSAAQRGAAAARDSAAQRPRPAELAAGPLAEAAAEHRAATAARGPAFRRKKAKGPNPLSIRPKQKAATQQEQAAAAAGTVGEGGGKQQRKRKRRRGKGGATGGDAAGGDSA